MSTKRKTFAEKMAETSALKRSRDLAAERFARAARERIAQKPPAAATLAYSKVLQTYEKRVRALTERHVLSRLPVLGSGDPLDPRAMAEGLLELQHALDALAERVRRSAGAAARRASKHAQREVGRMLNMDVPVGAEMNFIVHAFTERQVELVKEMGRRQVKEMAARMSKYREGDSMRETILQSLWVSRVNGAAIARTEVHQLAEREVARWASAVGSQGGITHTKRDELVRPRHRPLDGKFSRHRPPELDEPNCRCRWIPVEALVDA